MISYYYTYMFLNICDWNLDISVFFIPFYLFIVSYDIINISNNAFPDCAALTQLFRINFDDVEER